MQTVLNLKIKAVSCIKCHRPLRDPVSMARGMGRVCAGLVKPKRLGRKSDRTTLDMFDAVYSCKECYQVYDLNKTKECPHCGTVKKGR